MLSTMDPSEMTSVTMMSNPMGGGKGGGINNNHLLMLGETTGATSRPAEGENGNMLGWATESNTGNGYPSNNLTT